jgi:L-threonylcarbamoyladenylate synthase
VSPTTAEHVRAELGDEVPVIDAGPTTVGLESTIVDLSGPSPALLRPGAVPRRSLEEEVGPLGTSATPAPGTLPRHYAPRTALVLSRDPGADARRFEAEGRTVAVLAAGDGADHARRLYAELRRLDGLGVDVLVAELSSDPDLEEAINDRLRRAAHPS